MTERDDAVQALFDHIAQERAIMNDPETAHVVIDGNKVLGLRAVPGLQVDVTELSDGISANMSLDEGVTLKKTVHMCFGVLPKTGVQRIEMKVHIHRNANIKVLAHCVFPNAVDVKHLMDADIVIDEGASYSYLEKHVHGSEGGIKVYPKAKVALGHGASFKTEFELIKGRVGLIDIDYETDCGEDSTLEMTARINGTGDDVVIVHETGHLAAGATGVLTSKIALRGNSRGEIYNKLTASGPGARGHVDCKEIVQDQATASAVPIVEVNHPKAHITHEAAIGSVDSTQLQTLMSRGLSEDEATEVIIQGLLG
jgi:uncharacterized protein